MILSPRKALSFGWKMCFIYALFCFLNNYAFISQAQTAQGIIIKVKRATHYYQSSSRYGRTGDTKKVVNFFPVVKFKTSNGQLLDFTSDINCPGCKPGEKVNVIYLPDNPSQAKIQNINLWNTSLKYIALGVVLLLLTGLLGLFSWFINIVRRQKEESGG